MKSKLHLKFINSFIILISSFQFATAQLKTVSINPRTMNTKYTEQCGTAVPDLVWEGDFQKKIAQYKAQLKAENKTQDTIILTIPVIVHVIYQVDTSTGISSFNISNQQVMSQFPILNADFKGIGLNANNIPTAFDTIIGDTYVKFIPAQRDTLNNQLTELGVDRINVADYNIDPSPFVGYDIQYIDDVIKPATIWNPNKYLNVWVLNLASPVLGYATFPPGSSLTGIPGFEGTETSDGVVLTYKVWGDNTNNPLALSSYNKGRTASHEVGHWLGLRHIWGDDNGTCTADDFCDDTPLQDGNSSGGPTFPTYSCGNQAKGGNMFYNFMDYSNDTTLSMFSYDQVIRMRTALRNSSFRVNLVDSINNLSGDTITSNTLKPVANFKMNSDTTYPVNIINLASLSSNTPTSFSWYVTPTIPDIFVSPYNYKKTRLIVGPNTPIGDYEVCHIATNANGSDTICKNLHVLPVSYTCDDITNFTASDDTVLYKLNFIQGYVTGHNSLSDQAKAEKFVLEPRFRYGIYITGLAVLPGISIGTGTTKFNIWNADLTNQALPDSVVGYNIVNNSAMTAGTTQLVTFNQTYGLDSSDVVANSDVYYLGYELNYAAGDTFATASTLVKSVGENTAYERFQGTSGAWYPFSSPQSWNIGLSLAIKPIYCPTIYTTIQERNIALINNVFVHPNPSNGQFVSTFQFEKETDVNYEIKNILGQTLTSEHIKQVKNKDVSFDLSNYAKGLYILKVTTLNGTTSKQIIVE